LAYQQPPDGAGAEKASRESIRLGFSTPGAYYHLGRALLVEGRYDEAIKAFEQTRMLSPKSGTPDFGIAQVYLARKEYERSLQTFLRVPQQQRETALLRFVASSIYAGLGDREKSMTELQKALENGYRDFAAIDSNPHFGLLRSDPRFQQLLQQYRR
jgi:tetratricopeptide (TPR) repeat protein